VRVEIVPATFAHVLDLLSNLRERDRVTAELMYGEFFERAIVEELKGSLLAYAGLLDGRCVALWGVKVWELMSREGVLWMIGSRLVDERPLTFLRHSRRALEELRGIFKVLHGCVLTDYAQSRRWLEWLGFSIGKPQGGICACELRWA
jgi:hypothetical protein